MAGRATGIQDARVSTERVNTGELVNTGVNNMPKQVDEEQCLSTHATYFLRMGKSQNQPASLPGLQCRSSSSSMSCLVRDHGGHRFGT
jgi:hypothetical protein